MELSFMIIDENELDCFIARKIIEHTDKDISIKTFHNPEQAFETIRESSIDNGLFTIILLDLQMPLMNGFQFVEEFEKFRIDIQNKYVIIIVSSTRNSNDILRILSYATVKSMFEKPITKENMLSILTQAKSSINQNGGLGKELLS